METGGGMASLARVLADDGFRLQALRLATQAAVRVVDVFQSWLAR